MEDAWRRLRGRITWQSIAIGLLVVAVLIGVGIAGYQLGSPSNVDLDEVRAAATAAGREAGAQEGAEKGYAEGFEAAREREYEEAYARAYEEAYAAEFESAGLATPVSITVPEPR